MDHTNRLPWLIAAGAIMFALMVLIRSETSPEQTEPAQVSITPQVTRTPVPPAPPHVNETPQPQTAPVVRTTVPTAVATIVPTPQVTATPALPNHSIAGKVLDPDAKPIAKVVVRGSFTAAGSRTELKAVTDTAGKFTLSKIQSDELDALTFDVRGFSSNAMNKVPLPLPEELIVELSPMSGIDLAVVKADSPNSSPNPYTGAADITLFLRRAGQGSTQTLGITEANVPADSFVPVHQQSVTIENGTHALENVDPGEYKVGVSTIGSYAESLPLTVAAGSRTSASITMGVQWTVSGRVVSDPEKQPVSQANVELLGASGGTTGRPPQHTGFTDSEGRFVLPEVVPGSYTATIAASGFTTKTATLTVEALTPPLASEFALTRQQPALAVSILDPEGKPVPQARLTLITIGAAPARTMFGKSDAGGSYRFEKLPAGTYSLAVTAPEERSKQKTMQIVLADGELKSVVIQFGKQVRVTGRVKRGGKAYAGLLAFALRGTVGMEVMVKADENGGFATELEPGEYMVGRAEDTRSDVATIPAGETAQLELNIR